MRETIENEEKEEKLKQEEELEKIKTEDVFDTIKPKKEIDEIDDLNILEATKLAMKRAIANLPVKPSNVVIDGVRWEKLSNEINSPF